MPRRRQACTAPKTLLKHGLVPTTKTSTQAFFARPSSMARPTIPWCSVIGRAAGVKSLSSVKDVSALICWIQGEERKPQMDTDEHGSESPNTSPGWQAARNLLLFICVHLCSSVVSTSYLRMIVVAMLIPSSQSHIGCPTARGPAPVCL